MEEHLMHTLVCDRHQELGRIAAGAARAHRARAEAGSAQYRPLPLRFLGRFVGPR